MPGVCIFLDSLIREATAGDVALRVVPHGDGFAVGSEARGWVTLIPPIKVTTKVGRVFFDAQSGSARLKYRPQSSVGWRVYVDLYHGRSDKPTFEFTLSTNSAAMSGLLNQVGGLANESSENMRNDRTYIRYPAALSFFELNAGFSGRQIVDSFRNAEEIIKRYPAAAARLHALAVRAQETLFADLKEKVGFDRAAAYEDPMEMPSTWHASKILGVLEDSSSDAIHGAFREMAWAMHPDRRGSRYLFQLAVRARDVMLKRKG